MITSSLLRRALHVGTCSQTPGRVSVFCIGSVWEASGKLCFALEISKKNSTRQLHLLRNMSPDALDTQVQVSV